MVLGNPWLGSPFYLFVDVFPANQSPPVPITTLTPRAQSSSTSPSCKSPVRTKRLVMPLRVFYFLSCFTGAGPWHQHRVLHAVRPGAGMPRHLLRHAARKRTQRAADAEPCSGIGRSPVPGAMAWFLERGQVSLMLFYAHDPRDLPLSS